MGFYIETPCLKNKAAWLVKNHGAVQTDYPTWAPIPGITLLCVMENPFFDAAAIVYDEHEFNDFRDPTDPRFRTWLHIATQEVLALNDSPRLRELLITDLVEHGELGMLEDA